ncbi:ribonuclease H-like domain-containing protein [Tanacetum coccineum]
MKMKATILTISRRMVVFSTSARIYMYPYISRDGCYYTDTDSIVLPTGGSVIKAIINTEVAGKRLAISMVVEARLSEKEEGSLRIIDELSMTGGQLFCEEVSVGAMNYSSWVYYFSYLCHGYGILDHLVDLVASSSTTTPTDPPPKDAEWTKIDFIIRSWIFSTLAPSLRRRLVDLNPTTANDAWTYIEVIFQDNKRPRAMDLKAKLRNLKLGNLSIDGNDDVVTFALEGLPSTYETISTVIVSREPFPDLKTVRSSLTTHEIRLKSRVQNPLVDATSASPMVLLVKSNTSARRGPSLVKVNNPCWSFAKGSCRFGDACKYLHNGVHGKSTLLSRTSGSASGVLGVSRSDLDMLQSLLAKFGLNAPNISTLLL